MELLMDDDILDYQLDNFDYDKCNIDVASNLTIESYASCNVAPNSDFDGINIAHRPKLYDSMFSDEFINVPITYYSSLDYPNCLSLGNPSFYQSSDSLLSISHTLMLRSNSCLLDLISNDFVSLLLRSNSSLLDLTDLDHLLQIQNQSVDEEECTDYDYKPLIDTYDYLLLESRYQQYETNIEDPIHNRTSNVIPNISAAKQDLENSLNKSPKQASPSENGLKNFSKLSFKSSNLFGSKNRILSTKSSNLTIIQASNNTSCLTINQLGFKKSRSNLNDDVTFNIANNGILLNSVLDNLLKNQEQKSISAVSQIKNPFISDVKDKYKNTNLQTKPFLTKQKQLTGDQPASLFKWTSEKDEEILKISRESFTNIPIRSPAKKSKRHSLPNVSVSPKSIHPVGKYTTDVRKFQRLNEVEKTPSHSSEAQFKPSLFSSNNRKRKDHEFPFKYQSMSDSTSFNKPQVTIISVNSMDSSEKMEIGNSFYKTRLNSWS